MVPGHQLKRQNAVGATVGLLLGWSVPSAAAPTAEPITATLSPDSVGLDAGCVEQRAVETGTHTLMGREVFQGDEDPPVRVELRVSTDNSATIVLYDDQRRPLGRRTLRADSCAELTQALALALSLMLDFAADDVARLREAEAANGTAAEPPPDGEGLHTQRPVREGSAPQPEQPPRASRSASAFHASLEGKAGLGFAPPPMFALGLAAGWTLDDSFMLRLDGGYWFSRHVARARGDVEAQLMDGGLSALVRLARAGRLRAFAGVHGAVGLAHLSGHGYPEVSDGRALLVRSGLLGLAQIDMGFWLAHVTTGLATPMVGYRAVLITADGAREEFRSAPVLFVVTAGLGFAVP